MYQIGLKDGYTMSKYKKIFYKDIFGQIKNDYFLAKFWHKNSQ